MRGPVAHNGLHFRAAKIAGVEHLHVGTIGSELRIELVARDSRVKRLFGTGNRRQANGLCVA